MNKICTLIEQAKKLAEILPIESADMEYMFLKRDGSEVSNVPFVKDGFEEPECCYIFFPCWSLAALLDVLKYPSLTQDVENKWSITDWTGAYPKTEYGFDNPVDACYELILKLHELKML